MVKGIMKKLNKIVAFCISIMVVASCATRPPSILQLPNNGLSISPDSGFLAQSIGQTVRWGGTILETKNNKDSTQVTILAYPLNQQARPNLYRQNGTKRFIANFNYFIEPSTYTSKREITIIGKLDHIEQSKVGEFDYKFPVITVEKHVLWPEQSKYERDPYYYDDYYFMYGYGYGRYPFYWDYGRHHHYYGHYY